LADVDHASWRTWIMPAGGRGSCQLADVDHASWRTFRAALKVTSAKREVVNHRLGM
jgi:hypothetical protein